MAGLIQQLDTTTYKITPKDDPKDRIEVIIGDDKQLDFYPQTKLMRWDNECNFSVRLKENGKEKATVSSADDKVTWDKGNFKIEFYEAENAHKFVWYLKEKPATNKVEFTIQSKGLKFYYQPELTQKEIDDGCSRPENVVGSYAVYMEKPGTNWVGGKEYKAGKFGHIYRPHLYDSNGLEAWGDLHIEDGIYEVTIPQEFLDKAVFPIKSNDTFGYTTIGSSILASMLGYENDIYWQDNAYTIPAGCSEIDSMSYACTGNANTRNHKHILLDDTGTYGEIIGISNPITYPNSFPTSSFQTGTFSSKPSVSQGDSVYFGGIDDDYTNGWGAYDEVAGWNVVRDTSNSYSSPSNPDQNISFTSDKKVSVYATYTPAATGTVSPFPAFKRI